MGATELGEAGLQARGAHRSVCARPASAGAPCLPRGAIRGRDIEGEEEALTATAQLIEARTDRRLDPCVFVG